RSPDKSHRGDGTPCLLETPDSRVAANSIRSDRRMVLPDVSHAEQHGRQEQTRLRQRVDGRHQMDFATPLDAALAAGMRALTRVRLQEAARWPRGSGRVDHREIP